MPRCSAGPAAPHRLERRADAAHPRRCSARASTRAVSRIGSRRRGTRSSSSGPQELAPAHRAPRAAPRPPAFGLAFGGEQSGTLRSLIARRTARSSAASIEIAGLPDRGRRRGGPRERRRRPGDRASPTRPVRVYSLAVDAAGRPRTSSRWSAIASRSSGCSAALLAVLVVGRAWRPWPRRRGRLRLRRAGARPHPRLHRPPRGGAAAAARVRREREPRAADARSRSIRTSVTDLRRNRREPVEDGGRCARRHRR